MGNTIYASFANPGDAEKAAGALLDHGVKSEDLSVVSNQGTYTPDATTTAVGSEYNTTTYNRTDPDNDVKNAADAGAGWVGAAGNKIAEMGDKTAAAAAGVFGQDETQAKYDVAADTRNVEARIDHEEAKGQFNDAIDNDRAYSTATPNNIADTTTPVTHGTYVETDADNTEDAAKHGISTTTPEDAGAGAVKGAGWGLGIGAVAALAALFIPGVGFIVGGGALAAALGGVAAATGAGAAAGAVTGYLKDQGVEHHVAESYASSIEGGGALLAINVPSGNCSREEAMEVLTKYGANNVNAYDARTSSTPGYVA